MSLTKAARFLAFSFSLAACTSTPTRPTQTGTAGTSGAAGQTSGAAGSTPGTAGSTPGTAGSTAGSAGSTPGTAGATGTAGAAAGAGGAGGAIVGTAGTTGAAGATDGGATDTHPATDGGGSSYTRFVCPPPPYAAQMQGMVTNICGAGFTYNYAYNEGPTWIATQNAFFFSNFVQGNGSANKTAGDIIKVTLGAGGAATCEVWVHDAGCNGLGVSSTGKLLGACHGPRAVMEYDPVTKVGRVVSSMAGGKMYDSPNDLISHSNGTIYFSNTQYELGGRPAGGIGSALVRIDPDGTATVVATGGLNGMALSPDETKLYVVGLGVWNIGPDGKQTTKTNEGGPGGDGIAMDCAGRISNTGTNSAYGGADGKTLIAVGGGTAAKLIQMAVPGLP
jgi:gluconolactonase